MENKFKLTQLIFTVDCLDMEKIDGFDDWANDTLNSDEMSDLTSELDVYPILHREGTEIILVLEGSFHLSYLDKYRPILESFQKSLRAYLH